MAKKESGGRSSQQNDFLSSPAPINVVATNVGTSRAFDNGAASVSFELPAGSPAAISFTVTAVATGETTRTATGATSPIVVETLKSATTYTVSVTVTDAAGTSPESLTTTVAVTTVPAAPAAPTASSPNALVDVVSWVAPANGGSAITLYRWESLELDGATPKTNTTTGTSVNVTQEGSTVQKYRVRAENANGPGEWSPYSGEVTTTPPFFPPFFPFFPPFFPFFPPFFPFFPPFFPFFPPRFPFFPPFFPFFPFFPPRFPRFHAWCIHEDTLVRTSRGEIPAKDVILRDRVLVPLLAENTDTSPGDDKPSMFAWSSETLTFGEVVETEITDLAPKMSPCIYFNGNESAKFSITQTIYVKRDGLYKILPTLELVVGDILIKVLEDGTYGEELIETLHEVEIPEMTYLIACEPQDWFVAGGYLVHNK